MKIYFNQLGVVSNFVIEPSDSLRQGSVGNKITAIFQGKNNASYIATLNFTRSDGSRVSDLIMDTSNSDPSAYEIVFDEAWYFALAGTATITIYLRDGSGNVLAQGQVQIQIESSDYDPSEVPWITRDQYNETLALIATKVDITTFDLHAQNSEIHVSSADRANWNGKSVVVGSGVGTSDRPLSYLIIDGVEYVIAPAPLNAISWGQIPGTLSNQTDLQNALDAKQNVLTFDLVPTQGSSNPVTSDGLYTICKGIEETAAGKCKSYVINTQSEITGTKDANDEYTGVTAITGITLTDLKVGDQIFIKELQVPDYWVSALVYESDVLVSVSLSKMETSKVDLTDYMTKPYVHTIVFTADDNEEYWLRIISKNATKITSILNLYDIWNNHLGAQISFHQAGVRTQCLALYIASPSVYVTFVSTSDNTIKSRSFTSFTDTVTEL